MPDDRWLAEAPSQWRNRLNTHANRPVVANERGHRPLNQDCKLDTTPCVRPSDVRREQLLQSQPRGIDRSRPGVHAPFLQPPRSVSPYIMSEEEESEDSDDSSDVSDARRSSASVVSEDSECDSSLQEYLSNSGSTDSEDKSVSSEHSTDQSTRTCPEKGSDEESSDNETSTDESSDSDRSSCDEVQETSDQEDGIDRSFTDASDCTTAPSLLTESECSGDERFAKLLMPRSTSSSTGETDSTTDLDTSEEEDSEEDEEGYTTEEEEEEEDETSDEEEVAEDDGTDAESEEEPGREDVDMHSEEDSSPSSSPPSLFLSPSLPVPRLVPSRYAVAAPYSNPIPNAGRRLGAVVTRADRDETSSEESEYSDEEDSEVPEDPEEADSRTRRVATSSRSSSDEEDDEDEEVSDDGSSLHIYESSEEEMSEDEREQRKAEDQKRVTAESTALLGACTICHEDDVVEPTMCKNCKNIVGCYTCVSRWMRAANHPQCPLCRERWTENADRAIPVRLLY